MASCYRYNSTREPSDVIMAKEFVAINVSTSGSGGAKTYYCNLCSCNLSLLDEKTREFWCTRCNVSYFPNKEKVKRKSVFSTPGHMTNEKGDIIGEKTPIVSMVDDNKRELSSAYKQPKLSPFFKELTSRPGVRLLDYQTSED